ncbi:hypothetical protein PRIPAC_86127, partial [Pristionchus pacificus]
SGPAACKMAEAEISPDQWQLFWDLKEMFPNVSGAAIKQRLHQGHQAITELILEGQLPAGDEFIGDSEQPVTVVAPEPAAVPQPRAPVRPVNLIGNGVPMPQQPEERGGAAVAAPATPRMSAPSTPRTPEVAKERKERSKTCTLCAKAKPRVAHCHCINDDPLLAEEPDDSEHCVCSDCLKLRYMRGSLEGNLKALFCPVKKCDRVIGRDLLLAMVDKPAMVEWMLGSNVSLREASVRQNDREKKRRRDEEPQLTPEEKNRYENILDYIDEEAFVHASSELPDACFSWLLDNFDFGLKYLKLNQASATKRKLKRRDRAGVTHLVESRLKLQTTFTCSVCFEEYRTHLAVSCVVQRKEDTVDEEPETHSFCAECVQGHAKAALEQNVIVRSGIGIKCMEQRCANILMRAHIEQVLDAATLAALDPEFANEAILAAGLQAEKCQRCAFAAIIVEPPEQHPVFACRRETCRHQYCRMCGRVWDARHESKTCDELDPELMQRRMAERLDEMLIHKCPRCAKAFVKIDGCNKITCPCGQLSCYVCKAAVDNYDHFQDRNPSSGKCALWEDPTARERAEANAELNREIAGAVGEVAEALRRLQ